MVQDGGRLRLRYARLSGPTQRLLRTEGESGRFEFKRNADAVGTGVLVAAANAVALEGVESVTILVGVDERQDPATGVVTGEIVGLDNLERAREKITGQGRSTKPVPVGLRIFEENTATAKPILRLEITPTRVPHYTEDGKRVTRYGASTRAVTDEELVELYLDREAEAFETRFRRTAGEILGELGGLGDDIFNVRQDLEETGLRLEAIQSIADDAKAISDESRDFVLGLDEAIGFVREQVENLHNAPPTFEEAWSELFRARGLGWSSARFLVDRFDVAAPEADEILREAMADRSAPLEYERNRRETAAWYKLAGIIGSEDKDKTALAEQLLEVAKEIRDAKIPATAEELRAQVEASARRMNDPI